MTYPVRIIPQSPASPVDSRNPARRMTPCETRLDAECSEAPEPSVIYADMDANGEFIAVTIVSRSE